MYRLREMGEWSSVSRPKNRMDSTDDDKEGILYIYTMVEYIQYIYQGGEQGCILSHFAIRRWNVRMEI